MSNPPELPSKLTPEELRQMAEVAILDPRFQGQPLILGRTLAWLLLYGDEKSKKNAKRVLETCDDPNELFLSTLDQAVGLDRGDQNASDPKSLRANKNHGDHTSQGGSGPRPRKNS